MHKSILGACVLLFLAACGNSGGDSAGYPDGVPASSGPFAGSNWSAQTQTYRCEGGETLQVSYLNVEGADSFAALVYQGGLHLMQQQVAASGVRYIALDEQRSFRWHTKGDEGVLSFLAADHTAEEEMVLRDCQAEG